MKLKSKNRSSVGIATDDLACPLCDSKSVETFQHSDTFEYGSGEGAVTLRVQLPVRRCTACDFEFVDHEGERLQHEAVCRHLGVLTPAEVREVRERFGMTRSAFAEVSALGEATLARWETGAVIQNKANDSYLRLVRIPLVMAILERRLASGAEAARPAGVYGKVFQKLVVTDRLRQEQENFWLRPASLPAAA